MKYFITKEVLGFQGKIEIDESEYRCIYSARKYLFEVLFFEEKLDFMTENYYEYENELLSIASRNMIFQNFSYFSGNSDRNLISRRIINLMSACRLCLDQSAHHIKNILGENHSFVESVKQMKSSQYDNCLGYRVMEALRNYTQHRGYPIHNVRFTQLVVGEESNRKLLFVVVPKIKISLLAEDGKFKSSVLKELKTKLENEEIDIRPFIREYIGGIGEFHEKVREFLSRDVIAWEKTIEDTIEKFQHEFGTETSILGLAILQETDDGDYVESLTIFKDFIERRKELERKNSLFLNLHNRYASNEFREG